MIWLALLTLVLVYGAVPWLLAQESLSSKLAGALILALVFLIPVLAQGHTDVRLGADGMQVDSTFFPWSAVKALELDGSAVVVDFQDGMRARYMPRRPKQLVERAYAYMEASQAPRAERVGRYREDIVPPAVLVRVVQDPAESREKRIEAFAKLDAEDREAVLETIAEDELRDALT